MPSQRATARAAAAKACVGRSSRSASSRPLHADQPRLAAQAHVCERKTFTSRTTSSSARTSRTRSGFRSRSAPPRGAILDEEQQQHMTCCGARNVTEGLVTGCIEKSARWWAHATRARASAAFIAKTDDDAFVDLPSGLVRLLRAVRAERRPLVYGGWLRATSWFERRYFGCGWRDELARRAARAPEQDEQLRAGASTASSTTRRARRASPSTSPSSGRIRSPRRARGDERARSRRASSASPWVRPTCATRRATSGDGGARAALTRSGAPRTRRGGGAHAELGGDGHSFWQRELHEPLRARRTRASG